MAKDLTVALKDHPGTLADLGEALGKAGINIEGMGGFAVGGQGVVHLLVEDAPGARKALEGAGLDVQGESDAVVTDIDDRPGALGEIARKAADAGVNLTAGYLTTNGRLVLIADDAGKLRSLL